MQSGVAQNGLVYDNSPTVDRIWILVLLKISKYLLFESMDDSG